VPSDRVGRSASWCAYGFQRSEVVQSFLFPRGVEALSEALRTMDEDRYVLTGSSAAQPG
jgi:hypothetical protein